MEISPYLRKEGTMGKRSVIDETQSQEGEE